MCAMDHRASLQRVLDPRDPGAVGYPTMVAAKIDLCEALASVASAVLLDPVYGAAQAIAAAALPREAGLLVSMEATGYSDEAGGRVTTLLPDWNIEKTRRMGAAAAKLLVYYHPEHQTAAQQQRVVSKFAEACMRSDLPALVEAVSYSLPGSAALPRGEIVARSARELSALGIDVFKAEFPGDVRAEPDDARLLARCQQVDAASSVPWVLLSAGVSFEEFARQVGIACRAGASGFLGGRAVWQEAFALGNREDRVRWLRTVGRDRMRRLGDIAGEYARPWWTKWASSRTVLGEVREGWYARY